MSKVTVKYLNQDFFLDKKRYVKSSKKNYVNITKLAAIVINTHYYDFHRVPQCGKKEGKKTLWAKLEKHSFTVQ